MTILSRTALSACALLALPLFCQDRYVGRFDAFGGYTYLAAGKINLKERGFHMQIGMRPRSWYSLGFDYSTTTGHTSLTPDFLPDELRATLSAQLVQLARAGMLPAGYSLSVPLDSETQTFAAGPQVAYRRWKTVTLFARPSFGAIRELATPKPLDAIAKGVVAQLAPTGKKLDWTGFYGVGGGFDLNFSKFVSFRIQADYVYDHLYDDLLKDGRNTLRFSIGPAFQWGKNVSSK